MNLTTAQAAWLGRAVAAVRAVTPLAVPAYAPVAVAQAILESAWGTRGIGANGANIFGIKAKAGQPSVMVDTTEFIGGRATKVKAAFRAYASLTAAFEDHADLILRRGPYSAARAQPNDPVAFAKALTGVYATDPQYGSKLVRIMRDVKLPERFGFQPIPASQLLNAQVAEGGWRWPLVLLGVATAFLAVKL